LIVSKASSDNYVILNYGTELMRTVIETDISDSMDDSSRTHRQSGLYASIRFINLDYHPLLAQSIRHIIKLSPISRIMIQGPRARTYTRRELFGGKIRVRDTRVANANRILKSSRSSAVLLLSFQPYHYCCAETIKEGSYKVSRFSDHITRAGGNKTSRSLRIEKYN